MVILRVCVAHNKYNKSHMNSKVHPSTARMIFDIGKIAGKVILLLVSHPWNGDMVYGNALYCS